MHILPPQKMNLNICKTEKLANIVSENRLYNVIFTETNSNCINLSMANIENILFKDSQLCNSYFQETIT